MVHLASGMRCQPPLVLVQTLMRLRRSGTFTTRMHFKRRKSTILFSLYGVILLCGTLGRAQTAGLPTASCENELPPQVKKTVAAKLKKWKVVTVADLAADDREIWENGYEEKCPGITAGQFAPQPSRSWAVTLIRSSRGALYQTLVLVAEKNQRYQVTTLSPSRKVARPSIVRRLPGGSYSSARGESEIDAAFDVIGYETIEAGTIIYFWSNNKYRSLVISE
jgi:hypothetical protein